MPRRSCSMTSAMRGGESVEQCEVRLRQGYGRQPSHGSPAEAHAGCCSRERRLAERVGFEPTCRLPDKTLSRRSRYDHFGTSPQPLSVTNKVSHGLPASLHRPPHAPATAAKVKNVGAPQVPVASRSCRLSYPSYQSYLKSTSPRSPAATAAARSRRTAPPSARAWPGRCPSARRTAGRRPAAGCPSNRAPRC
jgi:hypothetical protein